mmetsp:Transcript_28599/g.68220  ORF Transcript_28599/g.68220 Transcript_28599/m.68220 type:complete len:259 (+) Transcript_28599:2757-3533(+)
MLPISTALFPSSPMPTINAPMVCSRSPSSHPSAAASRASRRKDPSARCSMHTANTPLSSPSVACSRFACDGVAPNANAWAWPPRVGPPPPKLAAPNPPPKLETQNLPPDPAAVPAPNVGPEPNPPRPAEPPNEGCWGTVRRFMKNVWRAPSAPGRTATKLVKLERRPYSSARFFASVLRASSAVLGPAPLRTPPQPKPWKRRAGRKNSSSSSRMRSRAAMRCAIEPRRTSSCGLMSRVTSSGPSGEAAVTVTERGRWI